MELLMIHHDDEKLKEARVRNSLWQMTKTQLVEKVREVQKRNEILEQDNADLHARMQEYLNRESAYWKTDEDGVVRCSKCHRKAPKYKTSFWGEAVSSDEVLHVLRKRNEVRQKEKRDMISFWMGAMFGAVFAIVIYACIIAGGDDR